MILKRLKIETMIGNYTNCYIIADEQKQEAMCIDPAGEPERILETLKLLNSKLKYIYLTHCHADHTAGLEELKRATNATILIHRIEYENLKNPEITLSVLIGTKQVEIEADSRIDQGDALHVRRHRISGDTHTRTYKSVELFYIQKNINYYSQETHCLKEHMVDVTFLLGNEKEILKSIKNKLIVLPEDTLIYPGHRGTSA
ncbi:MAG: MBL fold metallo-hydrolase [Clostridia bacterium]|nr:MBL fold metallo-hydrolase [Clostridia bacterium]